MHGISKVDSQLRLILDYKLKGNGGRTKGVLFDTLSYLQINRTDI